MTWNIYLSGEIHTNWRDELEDGAKAVEMGAAAERSIRTGELVKF